MQGAIFVTFGSLSIVAHSHYAEPPDSSYIIQDWTYTGSKNPPESANLCTVINLWLIDGTPPSDGNEVEFVIKQADLPPIQPAFDIYVSQDGVCGGKSLCFTAIQKGINSAGATGTINITQETYDEDVILNSAKELTLQGGWDANFTSSLFYTTINGSITISGGTMIIENIILQ